MAGQARVRYALLVAALAATVFPLNPPPAVASEIVPMSVKVEWTPADPTVGEFTRFKVTVKDFDGRVTRLAIYYGQGQGGLITEYLCIVPVAPYHETFSFWHKYTAAGAFDVRVEVETGTCQPILVESKTVVERIYVSA